MSQTSYSINIPAVSYPGQLADGSNFKDVLTGLAVAAALVYGTLAVKDEANTAGFDQLAAKAPGLSTDITVVGSPFGVVVADQARAQNPAVTNPEYPLGSAVSLLRQGRIWVSAETALVDATAPFVRFTANGALYLGNFRNDADSGKAAQLPISQGIVRGTTTGAGYAVIEVNLV